MCVVFLVSYLLLRTLVRSAFVLAPLLGFTYVIGLFANGYVLGYVYIILNDFLVSQYFLMLLIILLLTNKRLLYRFNFEKMFCKFLKILQYSQFIFTHSSVSFQFVVVVAYLFFGSFFIAVCQKKQIFPTLSLRIFDVKAIMFSTKKGWSLINHIKKACKLAFVTSISVYKYQGYTYGRQ